MRPVIRQEERSDQAQVEETVRLAFERTSEAELVRRLRESPAFIPELSLVAEGEGKIIGHVLLFPVAITSAGKHHRCLALAPVSVRPAHQKKGVGKRLIEEGLERAKGLGYSSVIVLGHSGYYRRFGFKPASTRDIRAPFEVPDDAFLALELEEGSLRGVHGTVLYPEEFTDV